MWLSDLAGRFPWLPGAGAPPPPPVAEAQADPGFAWRQVRRRTVSEFLSAETRHEFGTAQEPPEWPFGPGQRLL